MVEKSKFGSFRSNAKAGRMAERSAPLPSLEDRFRALERVQSGAAEPLPAEREPVVVEKIVERLVEVEKIVTVSERVSLEDILDRTTNIRGVSEIRAQKFATSIAVVGLIQPIAIDRHGRLLAGDHRRRALQILREVSGNRERLQQLLPDADADMAQKALSAWERLGLDAGVPVHRMDVDGEREPELAKAIELAENTNREDFTKEEVKKAWEQLRDAGYRDVVGRPKVGEKAMRPELALIFGKSLRTITSYLSEFRAAEERATETTQHASEAWVAEAAARLNALIPGARLAVKRTGAAEVRLRFRNRGELLAWLERGAGV